MKNITLLSGICRSCIYGETRLATNCPTAVERHANVIGIVDMLQIGKCDCYAAKKTASGVTEKSLDN